MPTPTYFMMRLVTSYLFHIFALEDARAAYQNMKFLLRYPDRFERKLRFSVFCICCEQFTITLAVEFFNLIFLCKQSSYEDLIMNYVAFVGILAMDNDFMNIQSKNHKKVNDWIENPTDHAEFKLYKYSKYHDRENLS